MLVHSVQDNGGILPTGAQQRELLAKTGLTTKKYHNFLRYCEYTVNKDAEAVPNIPDLGKLNFNVDSKSGCYFCVENSKRNISRLLCGTIWHKNCITKRISNIKISNRKVSSCSRCKKKELFCDTKCLKLCFTVVD